MSRSNEQGQVYATTKMTETEKNTLKASHQDAYVDKLEQFDAESTRLIHSYRTDIFGSRKEDSESMKKVKSTIQGLYLNMHEPIPFTTNTKKVKEDFTAIVDAYKNSMQACEAYISSHKNPWTQEGKARLAQVKQIYNLIKADQKAIPDCARRLYAQAKADPSRQIVWGNLLHEARSVQLRIDLDDHADTGGGTSHVYRLQKGDSVAFFKQNETVPPVKDTDRADFLTAPMVADKSISQKLADDYKAWIDAGNDRDINLASLKNHITKYGFSATEPLTKAQVAELMTTPEFIDMFANTEPTSLLRTPEGIAFLLRLANITPQLKTLADVASEAGIREMQQMAGRNVAASRLAKMLGIGDLVAESHMASVTKADGTKVDGILMKQAAGTSFNSLSDENRRAGRSIEYSPQTVRQLTNLQLLDTLCCQIDRHVGNYMVQSRMDGDRCITTNITGIDNDMAFGLHTWEDIRHGIRELPALRNNKTGSCILPCIDRNLYYRLDAMKLDEMLFTLQDVLKEEEIHAIWGRLCGMLELFRNTIDARDELEASTGQPAPKFLLHNDEWETEYYRFQSLSSFGRMRPYARNNYIPNRPEQQ